jgi:hypothetical protein
MYWLKLNVSDYTQIVSMAISFLSLVLSSVKLFYSQRLGSFLEVHPSIKMIVLAAMPITLQLLFPLFSLILLASYFREFVIVFIAIVVSMNAAVLKLKCLTLKLYCPIRKLYGFDDEHIKFGQKESEQIFYTALFTSWISPCTVWSNNFTRKSYFLIVSSLTTLVGHALGITFLVFLTYFEVFKIDLAQTKSPPITHCFKRQENMSIR